MLFIPLNKEYYFHVENLSMNVIFGYGQIAGRLRVTINSQ